MTEKQIFISYSRQQFYFVEELALRLQEAGVPVWFDVQQLEPGSDWAEDIEVGLETSDRVLLVASQASVTSPYVRHEWESAQEEGKPVYVALFEAVDLPPELSPQSVIDMRANFNRGVGRLVGCIREGRDQRDRVPSPNRLGVPLRIPLPVLLVALGLLSMGVYALAYLLPGMHFPALFSVVPLGLGAAALIGAATFLRRTFSYSALRLLTIFAIFTPILLPLTGAVLDLTSNLSWRPEEPIASVVMAVGWLVLILAVVSRVMLTRSADVYRWMPLGEAPQKKRLQRSQKLLEGPVITGKRSRVNYVLHADDADARIGNRVQEAMSSYGHTRGSASDDLDGGVEHIAVLSNRTPRSLVNDLVEKYERVNALVASSIALPEDVPELRRYQWIDYRTRTKELISGLARQFAYPESGLVPYSLNVVPSGLNKTVLPTSVGAQVLLMRWVAALRLAAVVLVLFSGLGVETGLHLSVPLAVLVAALGVAGFGLAKLVVERRVTFVVYALAIIGFLIVDSFFSIPLLLLLGFALTFVALRDWLPVRSRGRIPGPTLAAPPSQNAWLVSAGFVVVATVFTVGMQGITTVPGPTTPSPPPTEIVLPTLPAIESILTHPTDTSGPEWEQFSSEEGGFSVSMPGRPEQDRLTQPTAVGDLDLTMFTIERDAGAYFVAYADYPEEMITQADNNQILDGAAGGAVSNISGTLSSQQDITLDGYPGKEIIGHTPILGFDSVFKARFYLVGNRLYQLFVIVTEDTVSLEEVDAFLESFELTQARPQPAVIVSPTALPTTVTPTTVAESPTAMVPTTGTLASLWQEYSSEEDGFAVLMPGAPKRDLLTQPTLVGDVDLIMVTAEQNDAAYFVAYADYPEEMVAQVGADVMLRSGVEGAVSNINGTLSSEQDTTLDGYPGKEVVAHATISGVEVVIKARVYLVRNRIYQTIVVGVKDSIPQADIDTFLDSFELIQAD